MMVERYNDMWWSCHGGVIWGHVARWARGWEVLGKIWGGREATTVVCMKLY